MNKYISIDIGSENIKILLISVSRTEAGIFKILAKKSYPSKGIKFGYITNSVEFNSSLNYAIKKFEKEYGIKIEEAFFSLDGYGIKSEEINIQTQIMNGSVSNLDIENAQKKSKSILKNKTIDQIIENNIIKHNIDSFEHHGNIEGLKGRKLSTDFFYLTKPKNNLFLMEEAISNSDIIPLSFSPSLFSSASISVSKLDKNLGCALVDFGAEKTSIVIYENNVPIYYNTLKYGSKKITEKISLSEKIDFEKSEKIKKSNTIMRKIQKIIDEEITELAKKVNNELKKAGKNGLLPGGLTITGGGSKTQNIEQIFKKEISLPIKKAVQSITDSQTDYHIAYGNVVIGTQKQSEPLKINFLKILLKISGPFKKLFKKLSF